MHHAAIGVVKQPTSPDALNAYGAALEAASRPAEAAEAYESGLALAPQSPTLMTHLGNARRAAGQLAGAEEVLREALVLRPAGPEAAATYNSLGAVLQAAGQMEAALEAYQAAAANAAPGDADGLHATATANLNKLPTSDAYRGAAARETEALARRGAAAALAAWGASRAGRSARKLGLRGRGLRGEELLSVQLHRVISHLRLLETSQLPPLPGGEAHPHAVKISGDLPRSAEVRRDRRDSLLPGGEAHPHAVGLGGRPLLRTCPAPSRPSPNLPAGCAVGRPRRRDAARDARLLRRRTRPAGGRRRGRPRLHARRLRVGRRLAGLVRRRAGTPRGPQGVRWKVP